MVCVEKVQSFRSNIVSASTPNFFLNVHGQGQDTILEFWPQIGSGKVKIQFFLRITPCTQVQHPHNPQVAGPPKNKNKKRESISSRSTIRLNLSTLVGQIKVSPRYRQIAHHLALLWIHFFRQPHVRLRGSISPTATIGGGKRGESGILVTLGNIPCPD